MTASEQVWSVPVRIEEIPEGGRHFKLAPDAAIRDAVARTANLLALPHLAAAFEVTRHGRDGLRVAGTVSANVRQTCVVSLEPMDNVVEERVDLVFRPGAGPVAESDVEVLLDAPEGAAESPDPLVGGVVDLGAIATEFLILGIDPYPRRPDAVFAAPGAEGGAASPFAALAALARGNGEKSQ